MALVFGEIDKERICEHLILGSVAGFCDLLTDTLQKRERAGWAKFDFEPLANLGDICQSQGLYKMMIRIR